MYFKIKAMKLKINGKVQNRQSSFLHRTLLLLSCFLVTSFSMIYAQDNTITGTVTDETNSPLIGASVSVVGTTNGTMTDLDGKYSIQANSGQVLEFTFVGTTTQRIKVVSQKVIDVKLVEDATVLKDVVVVGYGSTKKMDLAGSIATVSAEDITVQPSTNALQSLQGKLSGVNIINSNQPGGSPNIVVRGLGTALGGRNPLYIVDGFPADNINNINPADIESMSILKDASSASIYGLRASNGVIMVTTKQGQEGKSKISVESYVGIKNTRNPVKMANADQYITYYNEAQQLNNNSFRLAPAKDQPYGSTDWYDEITRTGFVNNNIVTLSGGGKTVDYFFSYNYYDETGVLKGNDYNRTTIRNNNTFKFFNNRLTFKENLSVSFDNEHPQTGNAFNQAYRQAPIVPSRYADGHYGLPIVDAETGILATQAGGTQKVLNAHGNPLMSIDSENKKNKSKTIQGGIEGTFKITDYLSVSSRFGGTYYELNKREFTDTKMQWLNGALGRTEEDFKNQKTKAPSNTNYANNKLTLTNKDTYRWTWEGFATFNKSFGEHHLNVVAGISREKNNIGSENTATGYEFPDDKAYWAYRFRSDKYEFKYDQWDYTRRTLASYFGRAEYNFASKYYLSATIRRDGTSTFSKADGRWGTFPAFGAGWTITQEEFMKNVHFLDYLKLRGTWGKLGNQDIPLNVTTFKSGPTGNQNYVFGNGQVPAFGVALGSPAKSVSWENIYEWGIGIDFYMLKQRLTGSIDYYNKTTDNMVLDVKPAPTSPYSDNFYDHAAKAVNRGVEISLGWADHLENGFSYSINANYAYNKNKVKDVVPTYDRQTGGSLSNGVITKQLREGQPIYAWWMYQVDGVWQTQAEIDQARANGQAVYSSAKPGSFKYKDLDGDGQLTDRDKAYSGSYLPTSTYGINISLAYKNFDFNMDGYGVAGNKVYNGLLSAKLDAGENLTKDTFNKRWTGPGSTNSNPGPVRDYEASNYYLENGAYFRINNITLGYTFKDLVTRGTSLRMYVTAQNPFMFTGYSGFTPEIVGLDPDDPTNTGKPNLTSGIELSSYPSTRSFLFGVNLQF